MILKDERKERAIINKPLSSRNAAYLLYITFDKIIIGLNYNYDLTNQQREEEYYANI